MMKRTITTGKNRKKKLYEMEPEIFQLEKVVSQY